MTTALESSYGPHTGGFLTQTGAMFLDAYRDLNARWMFWVVLVLSVLVMIPFALMGANDTHLSFLAWSFPMEHARLAYKSIFILVVLTIWLTWAATILALISTAGIFPDFLAAGSVDVYLAKPISRLRLFMTKYVAALLFMTLQVSLFSLAAFLVLGLRIGEWKPAMFLAIPILVAFFSFIYCVCVFFGVWTRSTIASLLLTLLVWFAFAGLGWVERGTRDGRNGLAVRALVADVLLRAVDAEIAKTPATEPATASAPASEPDDGRPTRAELIAFRDRLTTVREESTTWRDRLETAYHILYVVRLPLPKTSETVALLDDQLFSKESAQAESDRAMIEAQFRAQRRNMKLTQEDEKAFDKLEAEAKAIRLSYQRPLWWTLGTSLAFEVAVLALAAWMFARRDY